MRLCPECAYRSCCAFPFVMPSDRLARPRRKRRPGLAAPRRRPLDLPYARPPQIPRVAPNHRQALLGPQRPAPLGRWPRRCPAQADRLREAPAQPLPHTGKAPGPRANPYRLPPGRSHLGGFLAPRRTRTIPMPPNRALTAPGAAPGHRRREPRRRHRQYLWRCGPARR